MAKGDDARSRNRITEQGGLAQNHLDNLRTDTLVPQNQTFWNYFTDAANQGKADYNNLMSGYDEFAKTGGFSGEDLGNIRARAVAPTRAVYANANREVNRSRALQGGYSPGFGTLKSRMAREQATGMSDAATNVEAAIAQLVQQGRLSGLRGGSDLYGTAPGMAKMFGDQALASTDQRLRGEQLQGQLADTMIRGQIAASQLPGKWESNIGRINDVIGIGSKIAGTIYPWTLPKGGVTGPSTGYPE